MLHKAMSRSNLKFLSLYVTSVKSQNNYLSILNSKIDSNCFQAKRTDITHLRTAHPTSLINCKAYSSEAKGTQEESKPKERLPVVNLTVFYCFKFLYALFRDNSIRYHVARSFILGSKKAFLYVSDCLHQEDYDGLTEVVTPELLERIKKQDKIRSEKTEPGVFLAKDVTCISLANINWKMDRETKIKTIEVLVRFHYFNKKVNVPKSLKELVQASRTGSVEGSPINFAHLKFVRTYGEEMKDSPWILKDLYYFTSAEFFFVSVK
ncbi:uncharacterized protein LOC128548326 [Mercenaria mercenaria]|uniref:uncharacterized protein LOC128548326 n=1 Tax=Mercenaria mercenaria TaxID=6596 RepID=UPI00234E7F43|nr:uncharacterized protein LOC128548326 [Mercenaria mercenaria]